MAMSLDRTHYDILGVHEDAQLEQIRAAFREAAKRHHPDKNADCETPAFREAREAYETLKDDRARAHYDAELSMRRRAKGGASSASVHLRPNGAPRPNRAVQEARQVVRSAFAGDHLGTVGGVFATIFAAMDEMRATWNETRLGFTDAYLERGVSGIDFDLEMSRAESAVGVTVEIPTRGGLVRARVPPGARHGDILEVTTGSGAVRLRVVIAA